MSDRQRALPTSITTTLCAILSITLIYLGITYNVEIIEYYL